MLSILKIKINLELTCFMTTKLTRINMNKSQDYLFITYIILWSTTEGASLALNALPPVLDHTFHHVWGKLKAARMTYKNIIIYKGCSLLSMTQDAWVPVLFTTSVFIVSKRHQSYKHSVESYKTSIKNAVYLKCPYFCRWAPAFLFVHATKNHHVVKPLHSWISPITKTYLPL